MMTVDDACGHAARLEAEGRWMEAEDVYRQILAVVPGHPLASYLYAMCLLARGEYSAAWPLFQRRLDTEFYRAKATTRLDAPYWQGEPAPGRTVLVHVDQGLGDLIMCARYLPMAAARVGRLILAVPAGMRALFASLRCPLEIVELGEEVPSFDLHLHAFSLPAVFATTLETIPPAVCLHAEPARVERMRARLGGDFTVGLCWQGNPAHPRDGARSLPLAALAPVLQLPGIRFVSLQVGPAGDQVHVLPPPLSVEDFRAELETGDALVPAAALISALDLTITVDSAIAHLAGALGRPVWIALPAAPDWRWLRQGESAAWYPTARLFRQPVAGHWRPCIDALARALAHLRASSSPSQT